MGALANDSFGQELDVLQNEFESKIRPTIEAKCIDCHAGPEANAGIDLEGITRVEQILESDRKWNKILHEIESGSMPPKDAEPLSKKETTILSQWIHGSLDSIDGDSVFPGRVTLRRLNRVEYRNTIRDILGVDFKAADSFPGDDVGYGFDHIGDVVSLPPLLFEKYLDAAEEISAKAIPNPDRPTLDLRIAGSSLETESDYVWQGDGVSKLFSFSKIEQTVSFPAPGTYAVVIKAYGEQAGDESTKM